MVQKRKKQRTGVRFEQRELKPGSIITEEYKRKLRRSSFKRNEENSSTTLRVLMHMATESNIQTNNPAYNQWIKEAHKVT